MAVNRPLAAQLGELLEASFNLPNATCELGRVELGPDELQSVSKMATPLHGVDAKAHYLLAGSGFNAEKVLSEIGLIHFAHRQATQPKSVEGFLSSKKDKTVYSSVDQLVAQSCQEFESYIHEQIHTDWKARKQEIYSTLGLVQKQQDLKKPQKIEWGRRVTGPLVLGSVENVPMSLQMSHRARDFAQVISEYNDARLNRSEFDLVNRLGESAKKFDWGAPQFQDAWDYLQLLESVKDPSQTALRHLEIQYRTFVDAEIDSHRQDAKIGGVPSFYNKIKAFVALKHCSGGVWDDNLTLINKTPIWVYLYYLVRCGCYKEALQLVLERSDIFELIGSSFAAYFKAWIQSPDHVLSPHFQEQIHSEYAQEFRPGQSYDPYRQALYKIIGRCDLQHRSLPEVATTTEDWIWLQLVLVRQTPAEFRSERYDLAELQQGVLSIGAEYFDPTGTQPAKLFSVLLLTGQFEYALNYLRSSPVPEHELIAVHLAIALHSMGAIKIEEEPKTAEYLVDSRILNYSVLLGHYTRYFRQSRPVTAVDYLVLLPTYVARESLQELVLETRAFGELLGDIGLHTGAIERRMGLIGLSDRKSYCRDIAFSAAEKAESDGRTLDAILLYRLAGESDRVLQMVNRSLGQALSQIELGQPLDSLDVLQLARNLTRLPDQKPSESRNACITLLTVADALHLLASGQYERCLEQIAATGLLALSPDASVSLVREMAQQFTRFDDSIARTIPNLLLAAMTCCIRITHALKESGSPMAAPLFAQFQQRANNCMMYAGLIQYRMPRAVYSRLTQMEAQLS